MILLKKRKCINMQDKIIPRSRFNDVFTRLGWAKSKSKSGKYDLWTSNHNKNIWALLPLDSNSLEYKYNQEKNVELIVLALGLTDNDFNKKDVYSQLIKYNYKLINKIINKEGYEQDKVPFELAGILPLKNINAFRTYYAIKTHGTKSLNLDQFEFNHTQEGSFIIPISINVPEEAQNTQTPIGQIAGQTNTILRDYLNTIDKLTKINTSDENTFSNKIIEENIDSMIVKDFYSKTDGFAKYREKYEATVKDISIYSTSNPILDFNLNDQDKKFTHVELGRIKSLPDDYLKVLIKKEEEADQETREETNARIDVAVDSVDLNGTAKFTVLAINGQGLKKSFKARSVRTTKENLNFCADAFKSRDTIEIRGDLFKPKGKLGELIPGEFIKKEKQKPIQTSIDDIK